MWYSIRTSNPIYLLHYMYICTRYEIYIKCVCVKASDPSSSSIFLYINFIKYTQEEICVADLSLGIIIRHHVKCVCISLVNISFMHYVVVVVVILSCSYLKCAVFWYFNKGWFSYFDYLMRWCQILLGMCTSYDDIIHW